MFHSVNVFTGETLYRRPDQDYAEFERRLADLKMHGRAFAQLGVTERAARLQNLLTVWRRKKSVLRKWCAKKSDAACTNAVPKSSSLSN